MKREGAIRPWQSGSRLKLIPLLLAVAVSLPLPFSTIPRVLIGTILYLVLYLITWRHRDGRRVLPPYLW